MGFPKKSCEEKKLTRQNANRRFRQDRIKAAMRSVTIWTHFPRTNLPDNKQYMLCVIEGIVPDEILAGNAGVKISWVNVCPVAGIVEPDRIGR